ncbi:MAG TPA: cytochrome c biogenesis protein CcdA [Rhodobacteraceae bacterium]|nr:cytochrome c biogenesis protein CcdA [Paracoccaceae bacterium]
MFDVTSFGAFIAGLLSFLSPCVLPIVPFYLSYLAGVSMNHITAEASLSPAVRLRAFISAMLFAAGVITIFMGLGAGATAFGQLVNQWFGVLRYFAAAIIILMGLHFLGVIKIGVLYRQFRADAGETSNLSYFGAYLIGLAFAFGWTPCVGPVLAAILFTAAGQESATQGMWLLFVYGFGMTLPFVLAALFIGPFMRFMARFRRHLGVVEKIMGLLLIVFGIMIATGTVNVIGNWLLQTFPVFSRIG